MIEDLKDQIENRTNNKQEAPTIDIMQVPIDETIDTAAKSIL